MVTPSLFAAGPPISYDSWSATNGDITDTACGGGFDCTIIAQEKGFLYVTIEDSANPGAVYSRMVLTEADANGNAGTLDFAAETFTQVVNDPAFIIPGTSHIAQGIASKQHVRDTEMDMEMGIQLASPEM